MIGSALPSQAALPGPTPGPLSFPEPPREAEDEDDEEEWSGSYRPSAVERAHACPAGSFPCEGPGAASPRGAAPGPGGLALFQPSYEQLKEENASLRSKINKLQILSETQADKMRKLEKKLEENKIKEEKEARDLEAMVQHVEQNLQLMTKRAVKAENNATKLKQENALLQVQLKNYKTENEALRSGQSASLAVVKQNAELALQNLLTVITNSRSSIRQLVSGAESLQLVADLLKSIDRISEVSEHGQ
ncbi:serologically defined colon cancer antigen 3 [Patagioenas fasciata monilis]|uniref:Endosome-associated-trafficking regulator 1 n=1 Tax=Patagioenas fasciata monilis TaxID=372326 RepID=A0A1V4J791_PATFA|nr:serologically defined colon cancer antigen 3 [Patagioenas fasciata monilis]